MKNKILLVGGNGFIGSHLVDQLVQEGYSVHVLDQHREIFRKPVKGVEYHIGSFSDLPALQEAVEGCDILIHLAHSTIPLSSLTHPEQEVLDSVSAFVNMINCFKKRYIRKIVFFSSGGAVYGNAPVIPTHEEVMANPISPYGVAKLTMEKYLCMFSYLYGLEFIIVRPSNPFGPRQNFHGRQGAIPIFMHQVMNRKPIHIWGDGSAVKDYFYITDLARGVVSLIKKGFDNSVYNIGSGRGVSTNELLAGIEKVCGIKPQVEYVETHACDVQRMVLSTDKIRARTGWAPEVPLEKGIELTHDWLASLAHDG